MKLSWQRFTDQNAIQALSKCYCLYVFHHPDDGDSPFYIGKAKYFGPNQANGYVGSARYNAGYQHLLMGLLRAGFSIYIAEIGEAEFAYAEEYEQELIALWNPVRKQRVTVGRRALETDKPWNAAAAPQG
jgi:hypothetical protein